MRWKFAGTAWPGRVRLFIAVVVDVLIGTFMFFMAHAADPKVFDQVKVDDRVDITWSTDFTIAVD